MSAPHLPRVYVSPAGWLLIAYLAGAWSLIALGLVHLTQWIRHLLP